MIVHEHLAAARESREREDAPHVSTRDDARRLHDAVRIQGASEADLASTGESNRRTNRECGRGTQPSPLAPEVLQHTQTIRRAHYLE